MNTLDELHENREVEAVRRKNYELGYFHAMRDLENYIDSKEMLNDTDLLDDVYNLIVSNEVLRD